jgi:hypothetical protein
MTAHDLEQKAQQLITAKIKDGQIVQMHWAVQELILQQGPISGDGVEFFLFCAREHVYRVVKKIVDRYECAESEDGRQIVLAGFEYLQAAYTVKRGGEIQLVPVHLISDDELLMRACEFKKQIIGLNAHAMEIERYVANRNSGGNFANAAE